MYPAIDFAKPTKFDISLMDFSLHSVQTDQEHLVMCPTTFKTLNFWQY